MQLDAGLPQTAPPEAGSWKNRCSVNIPVLLGNQHTGLEISTACPF